jgi:excisionase family DNA binding protein
MNEHEHPSDRKHNTDNQKPPAKDVSSPFLTAEEAARYLRITRKALYGLVERRKLRPLPGSRRYRFTTDQLDAYLRGETP